MDNRMQAIRNLAESESAEIWRSNRISALMAAATWLSGPSGGIIPDDVVAAARVFEQFLNE